MSAAPAKSATKSAAKTPKAEKVAAPAPAVVAAPVAAPSTPIVAETASPKKVSKKAAAATAVEAAPAPAVVAAPVAAAPAAEATTEEAHVADSVQAVLDSLAAQCEASLTDLKSVMNNIRRLQKAYNRERRQLASRSGRREARKARAANTERKPSGFEIPKTVSAQLCKFLGVPAGTQISRTQVTTQINKYIKDHKLQTETNKRGFNPDKALKELLGDLQEQDKEKGYTYFNLQRYITPHFAVAQA
jgi:chromatin remodeling complex protein RSC6